MEVECQVGVRGLQITISRHRPGRHRFVVRLLDEDGGGGDNELNMNNEDLSEDPPRRNVSE